MTGPLQNNTTENQDTDSDTQFTNVAPMYDLLMSSVPYSSWMEYLARILHAKRARPRNVLDLACGTGNVTELLAEAGYSAVGVDIAPEMIKEAIRKAEIKGLSIQYYVQDGARMDLPGKRFDLCVSLFDSLNYILEPAQLFLTLEKVYAHLTPNGLFVFDMNSEYALMNNFFDQNNIDTDDALRYIWTSSYNSENRRCTIDMDFTYYAPPKDPVKFREVHHQFAYREDEVREMLQNVGYRNITTYRAYTFRATSPTTDRIYYVATR